MRDWFAGGAAEDREFRVIWLGQSVSLAGTWVTIVALPLTAAMMLGATPFEMGLLAAAQTIPYLLFSIVAGVVADRADKRAVLISTEAGRAMLLISVPIAAYFGALSLAQLYVVSFFTAALAATFEATFAAYLPALVSLRRIADANARVESSRGVAQLVFPTAGGALAQLLTAPGAIVVDAVSYVFSAYTFALVRRRAKAAQPAPTTRPQSRLRDAVSLLLLHKPALRSLTLSYVTFLLSRSAMNAVFYWFMVNELQFTGLIVGVAVTAFAPGQIAGSVIARRLAQRAGVAATLALSMAAAALGIAGIATLTQPGVGAVVVLVLMNMLGGLAGGVYNVVNVSSRQVLTPPQLQGRVAGLMQTLARAAATIGVLGGGALAEVLGVHAVMWIAAAGALASAPIAAFSDLRVVSLGGSEASRDAVAAQSAEATGSTGAGPLSVAGPNEHATH